MAKNIPSTPPSENKMGVLPVGKLLVNMAVPIMISMLVQALYNVVDSIFVSQVSENALTAVSLAFPLQCLIIAVCSGTTVGMNALLSRALGAKEPQRVSQIAHTGIVIGLCTYVLFAILGVTCSRLFFQMQTDVAEIVDMGTHYSIICLGLSVGIFVQFTFERLLQSTGRTKLSMYVQILGAGLNIILDPILIFGLFGLPAMGVTGAAIATAIGQCAAAAFGIFLNAKYNPEIKLRFRQLRLHMPTVRSIYRIGIPSIIMQCIGSVMVFGLNRLLLSFTTTAAAVFGAYFKLQSFVFMPVFGLTSGMVPILAYNYGAKKPERVKTTIRLSVIIAVVIMSVGLLIFELFPGILLSLFKPSANMLEIGLPALRIIAIHFPLAGFAIIASSVFQAIGNPFHSLIVSVCRQLFVLMPVAWLLGQMGNLSYVWLAFPISEVVSLIISAIFLKKTIHSTSSLLSE